jgi:hypothetical protein
MKLRKDQQKRKVKSRPFPKMPTPKFRHGHGKGITLKKHQRTRWDALCYFAGITKPAVNALGFGW